MQRMAPSVALATVCLFLSLSASQAQSADPRYFDIGNPALVDIWLDPVNGSDSNDGSSRTKALRTLTAAWNRIPKNVTLTGNGYRINITPGSLPCERGCANYYADRLGTHQFPVIIRAADGRGTATIQGGLNIYGVNYLYLIDLNLIAGGALGAFSNNVLHLDRVDHVVMRGLTIRGESQSQFQEVLKANQSRHLYLEESEISGATGAVVDYFAAQHGHIINNRIHGAGGWGAYLKGGSAYFRVEANEIYDCFFGFSAGEGAELTFLESPWLHYEAYDIKFVNNVLHDLPGTGISVAGGYNILLAHNTLYRTAYNADPRKAYGLITLQHGLRACNGAQAACTDMTNRGAWGPYLPGYENSGQAIPNRNVFVYNNIFYNPAPYRTYYGHFVVYAAAAKPASFQNLPDNLAADENLRIRGNLIWNGPPNFPLGIEHPSWGCQPSNPTCNASQLIADNAINSIEPQFADASNRDYRVKADAKLIGVKTYSAPDFGWSDAPVKPAVPAGNLSNAVDRDRGLKSRASINPPGAYTISSAAVVSAANYRNPVATGSLVAAFGENLAATTEAATSSPLPTVLGGATVTVRDSAGTARLSPLFVVSPNQINYQIPDGTAIGAATVSFDDGKGSTSIASLQIAKTAPGIFTADASGKSFAAAGVLRVRADGSQKFEQVARFDSTVNRFTAIPIDFGAATDQLYLVLYGTGIRHHSGLSSVQASIGGRNSQVIYAGPQNDFVGLDQVNVRLDPGLAGRGEIDVILIVDGSSANTVKVHFK